MKNLSLEKLKPYQMSRATALNVNGGGALEDCIATAKRDGNDWLIPTCHEVLGDSSSDS